MAQSYTDYPSLTHSSASSPAVSSKLYLDSNAIYISDNQIFANVNGELLAIPFISVDEQGIYTYVAGYQPWHDDDWQCSRGHWNPMYENNCVVCKKLRTPKSPRWGDR